MRLGLWNDSSKAAGEVGGEPQSEASRIRAATPSTSLHTASLLTRESTRRAKVAPEGLTGGSPATGSEVLRGCYLAFRDVSYSIKKRSFSGEETVTILHPISGKLLQRWLPVLPLPAAFAACNFLSKWWERRYTRCTRLLHAVRILLDCSLLRRHQARQRSCPYGPLRQRQNHLAGLP
ncbi:hypothetical protein cyc_07239 [Cyclospora cayetanensis]|uniref:Uncharacterized protein n=1 Tax=Cyclospora cayetanensis TaxID=88456 RepID=A0A1D3D0D0_9EIME|nr:hypothetical protein cyc_07239 [Cyclospora cayetanensis]